MSKTYIEQDPTTQHDIGEYADALPRWTPSHKADDGRYIEVWFNSETRDWVAEEFNSEDNSLQNIYSGTKEDAIMNAKIWQNDWWKQETK